MRLALALAVGLLWTSGAVAQTAPDRYGPPRTVATPTTVAALYDGPVLRWASKRAPAAIASTPVEPARPEPMILARQYVRTPQAATPAPRLQAPAADPALRPAQTLPASLYDVPPAPRPQVAAAPPAPAPRTGGTATRLYSLHREYGMAPDVIPETGPAPRYVLIGPPDAASAPAPRDTAGADDANDRPF